MGEGGRAFRVCVCVYVVCQLLLLGARWVFEALPARAGAFGDAEEDVDDIGVETSCESVRVGPRLLGPVGMREWEGRADFVWIESFRFAPHSIYPFSPKIE